MKKIVIARQENTAIGALLQEGKPLTLQFLAYAGSFQAGTVVVARVEQVKKELSAAFVSIAPGVPAYLQLQDPEKVRQGDLLLVQVERPAGRNKRVQVSDRLSFYGKYVGVLEGRKPVGVSARITEEGDRERLKALMQGWLADHPEEDVTAVLRTNALFGTEEEILAEAETLLAQIRELRARWPFCAQHAVLQKADSDVLRLIRDNRAGEPLELVTDIPAVAREAEEYKEKMGEGSDLVITFYEDPQLSLCKLHGLDYAVHNAMEKRVWLRSGGFLVMEHTEAMTVIDVNTGKSSSKGSPEQAFLQLNLEAAVEIPRQLRLRNISGIIIVDFIDMKDLGHREQLIRVLKEEMAKDPIKTTFHGLTTLGLAELTRKKTSPPLYEQAKSAGFFLGEGNP